MEKVFLDANILFSAAYKSTRIRQLWHIDNIGLISSDYAVMEAERNLTRLPKENLDILQQLLTNITIIEVPLSLNLIPETLNLVEKDSPILTGAIFANCDYLLTGDFKHFGHLFNQTIKGVTILSVAIYFNLKNFE
jgi:predicted nucleic acid-binding protein